MIGNSWDTILKDEFKKDYFKKLSIFLNEEVKHKTRKHRNNRNIFYKSIYNNSNKYNSYIKQL